MKLTLTVRCGSEVREHHLELNLPHPSTDREGITAYRLGSEAGELEWAEVAPGVYSILLGGRSYEAQVAASSPALARGEGHQIVTVGTRHYEIEVLDPRRRRGTGAPGAADGPQEVVAPMPGKIVKILVAEHQEVRAGGGLLVIEAMKMQNELRAPRAGRVEAIYVEEGKGVETGARLVRLA